MASFINDVDHTEPNADAEIFQEPSGVRYFVVGDVNYKLIDDKTDKENIVRWGAVTGEKKWVNGIVPIKFASNATDTFKSNVKHAFAMWADTGLRPVEANGERDCAIFQLSSKQNNSWVGRQGGEQTVNIKNWDDVTAIAHEIGHLFGLHHEHQRPDRDDHIVVNDDIVVEKYKQWFIKKPNLRGLGKYDLGSIMHYAQEMPDEVYKAGQRGPIILIKSGVQGPPYKLGYAPRPSKLDIQALREHYQGMV